MESCWSRSGQARSSLLTSPCFYTDLFDLKLEMDDGYTMGGPLDLADVRTATASCDDEFFLVIIAKLALVLLKQTFDLRDVGRLQRLDVFIAWVLVQFDWNGLAKHHAKRTILRWCKRNPKESTPEERERDAQVLLAPGHDTGRWIVDPVEKSS